MWPVHVSVLPQDASAEEPLPVTLGMDAASSVLLVKEEDRLHAFDIDVAPVGIAEVVEKTGQAWRRGSHNSLLVTYSGRDAIRDGLLALLEDIADSDIDCWVSAAGCPAKDDGDYVTDLLSASEPAPKLRKGMLKSVDSLTPKRVRVNTDAGTQLASKVTSLSDKENHVLLIVTLADPRLGRERRMVIAQLCERDIGVLFPLGAALRSVRKDSSEGIRSLTARNTSAVTLLTHHALKGAPCELGVAFSFENCKSPSKSVHLMKFATELCGRPMIASRSVNPHLPLTQDLLKAGRSCGNTDETEAEDGPRDADNSNNNNNTTSNPLAIDGTPRPGKAGRARPEGRHQRQQQQQQQQSSADEAAVRWEQEAGRRAREAPLPRRHPQKKKKTRPSSEDDDEPGTSSHLSHVRYTTVGGGGSRHHDGATRAEHRRRSVPRRDVSQGSKTESEQDAWTSILSNAEEIEPRGGRTRSGNAWNRSRTYSAWDEYADAEGTVPALTRRAEHRSATKTPPPVRKAGRKKGPPGAEDRSHSHSNNNNNNNNNYNSGSVNYSASKAPSSVHDTPAARGARPPGHATKRTRQGAASALSPGGGGGSGESLRSEIDILRRSNHSLEMSINQQEVEMEKLEEATVQARHDNEQVSSAMRATQKMNTRLSYDLRRLRMDLEKLQDEHSLALEHIEEEAQHRKEVERELRHLKDKDLCRLREDVGRRVRSPIRSKTAQNELGDLRLEMVALKSQNTSLRKKLANHDSTKVRNELDMHQKVLETLRERVRAAEHASHAHQQEVAVLKEQKAGIARELAVAQSGKDRLLETVAIGNSYNGCLVSGTVLLHAAAAELLERGTHVSARPSCQAAQADPASPFALTFAAVQELESTISVFKRDVQRTEPVLALSQLRPAIGDEAARLVKLGELLTAAEQLNTNLRVFENAD